MSVERIDVFADTFSGNGDVVTLVAKATAPQNQTVLNICTCKPKPVLG